MKYVFIIMAFLCFGCLGEATTVDTQSESPDSSRSSVQTSSSSEDDESSGSLVVAIESSSSESETESSLGELNSSAKDIESSSEETDREPSSSIQEFESSSDVVESSSSEPSEITNSITASKVSVDGYELFVQDKVDGEWGERYPYVIKGVCWGPVDSGFVAAEPNYKGNVKRDAVMMQEAHINTIRMYGSLPRIEESLAVLDTFLMHGIRVLFTVTLDVKHPVSNASKYVNYFKDHPAILGWIVGNEINYSKFYGKISWEEAVVYASANIAEIRANDSNHPVIVSWGDPRWDYETGITELDFDILAVQLYLYDTFEETFSRHKQMSDKPLLISEYGGDDFDATKNEIDEDAQAWVDEKLTKELAGHLASLDVGEAVAIGGTVFAWNDEWWKSAGGSDHIQDDSGIAPGGGPYPDRTFNEEHWGLVDINRNPKKAYFAMQDVYGSYWLQEAE